MRVKNASMRLIIHFSYSLLMAGSSVIPRYESLESRGFPFPLYKLTKRPFLNAFGMYTIRVMALNKFVNTWRNV